MNAGIDLSDEQKQRIREEEQQRLAEEQYRAQVRQELNNRPADSTTLSKKPKSALGRILLKMVVFIVVSIGAINVMERIVVSRMSASRSPEPYAPSEIVTNHTQKIGSSQAVVSAGRVLYYRFPINGMRDIHITGHFLALGGQGNDIDVLLADESEFGKWMDGKSARVYYQSGRATSGDIDTKLPSADKTYYLCFDNRFSMFSAKTVNADINLSYTTITLK